MYTLWFTKKTVIAISATSEKALTVTRNCNKAKK